MVLDSTKNQSFKSRVSFSLFLFVSRSAIMIGRLSCSSNVKQLYNWTVFYCHQIVTFDIRIHRKIYKKKKIKNIQHANIYLNFLKILQVIKINRVGYVGSRSHWNIRKKNEKLTSHLPRAPFQKCTK